MGMCDIIFAAYGWQIYQEGTKMKFGFVFPFADAKMALEAGHLAEEMGWDGFFVWEAIWGVDAWVMLGALAATTHKMRLGTMITPVSRRRPWKLASEVLTVDLLSNGRAVLAVGLGALDTGFANFGEETDRKIRAERLDEGLAIIDGLWRGQPFSFAGKHYQLQENQFLPPPPPVQQPRIPIWVVGAWPRPRSMERVIKWDGLLPAKMSDTGQFSLPTPDEIREIRAYVAQHRLATTPFDIVVEGVTNPGQAEDVAQVQQFADAGATWWIEALWSAKDKEALWARIKQGPPVS